jgi:GTP-binding protein
MKPVIALVGRPNVGKSTLFNRLTKSRDAIVADFAGLTRDRHYGDGRLGDREFICIDTGGFEPDSSTGIVKEMAKQTKQAVAEADAVIFVVDIRLGLSAHDSDIARYLRSVNKRVHLAVNKAEGMSESPLMNEFHELGMGDPHPISSAHGQGIRRLRMPCWSPSRTPARSSAPVRSRTALSAWQWPAAPTWGKAR